MVKRLGVVLGLVAGLAISASVFADVIVLDENDAVIAGPGVSSVTFTGGGSDFYKGDGMRVTGGGASATYTPNVSGEYNLWTNWRMSDGTYTYAVSHAGGTTLVTVDATKSAAQGATGAWAPNGSQRGSGYCYLGKYTLNAGSTVQLTCSVSMFDFDALRLASSDDVFIVDEHAAISNAPSSWAVVAAAYGAPSLSADPNLNWAFNSGSRTSVMKYPLLAAGSDVTLKLSWAVGYTPTDFNTAAKYWFDPDINNGDDTDWVSLATINQNLYADQLTPTTGGLRQWSGWYTVSGTFDVYSDNAEVVANPRVSAIILDPNGNLRTTADVVGLLIPDQSEIPEPGTLLLIGTGVLGVMGWARRRRMN